MHTSGHASAGELLYTYNVVQPSNALPIHGEARHLVANAELAKATGVPAERAIVAEYKAGQTMKQIAARHNIRRVTVSEVLDRTDTTKRPKGMSPSQVDIAARLYESGLSLARVGAQLGFDAATIRTMLLRNGIGTRDSHGREK